MSRGGRTKALPTAARCKTENERTVKAAALGTHLSNHLLLLKTIQKETVMSRLTRPRPFLAANGLTWYNLRGDSGGCERKGSRTESK